MKVLEIVIQDAFTLVKRKRIGSGARLQAAGTVQQIVDKFAYDTSRSTQSVRQQYDARTITSCSLARLPLDGRANLQNCRKDTSLERRRAAPAVRQLCITCSATDVQHLQCDSCANFSCSFMFRSILATALH